MELSRYRFLSAWSVDARRDAVFDALADFASYPRWWPQIRSVERIDDDTASVVCRSALPYDLRLRAARTREERAEGLLEVRLTGDLDGWSRWTLTPGQGRTDLVYEQEVVVHGRTLRRLGLVARPLLRLNHRWMMRRGRRGLDRWLAAGHELDRVLVHGRRPVAVELVEYDEEWPRRFAAERDRVRTVLRERAVAVHHVGSTAVPGLAAKDRVDVCLEVADPDDEAAYLPDLLEAGYALHVVEPGHRCLVRADAADPPTNLHVYASGAAEVAAYLRFRDRLRSDADDRRRYEDVKRSLAGREWPDVNYYADAKGPVVREILARADDGRLGSREDPLRSSVRRSGAVGSGIRGWGRRGRRRR